MRHLANKSKVSHPASRRGTWPGLLPSLAFIELSWKKTEMVNLVSTQELLDCYSHITALR